MARRILTYVDPRRFIAGTVGMPGERTFYLQASDGQAVTSVALEKAQVAMLAERVQRLVEEVGADPGAGADDNDPLSLPLEEEFRVGTLGISWLPEAGQGEGRVLIEAHALGEAEAAEPGDDDDEAADTLRVSVTAESAAVFARRAAFLVAAGRPPCPFCLQPLDPGGHICPRANGYRRRA